QPDHPQNEEHREKLQPDFVDRIAAVEYESGGDGHRQRGEPADISPDERFEFQGQIKTADADEHDRQTEGQDMSPEQCLTKEENVKMERAVIVRRVVAVKAVLHHLIDEPAVDPLVEMRRLHLKEDEPEKGAERDN